MANLIVLSDIHVAKKWDELEKIFPERMNYLNPNKYLREVIASLKPDDTLVFNGDLVDYYYCEYSSQKKSNWNIFLDIVKHFKGKCFFNVGNHDYRKNPYNFSIYGLNHVNINKSTRKKYAKRIGFNKFRFFRELDSIRVNLRKFNPLPKRISSTPKHLTIPTSKVLLLDTGPDALTKFSQIINPFSWPYVLSKEPSSLGLSDKEIRLLENILSENDNKEVILFLHCPPFFSKNIISPIKLSAINYRIMLIKNRLTYATFSKNNWKFIDKILKSNKNIIVITSHSHIPKQYIIDKKTNILKESSMAEINDLRKQHRYVKFISTLSLGGIRPHNKIGYLKIGNNMISYQILKEFNEIAPLP